MQYIGKLNKKHIGKYFEKIITNEIVLTDERKLHIYEFHYKDYNEIMHNIKKTILKPNLVIEDIKNKDTLFYVKKLKQNNLNIVIKLATVNSREHPKNSVMTAWIIRDSNLKKIKERNIIIYKYE